MAVPEALNDEAADKVPVDEHSPEEAWSAKGASCFRMDGFKPQNMIIIMVVMVVMMLLMVVIQIMTMISPDQNITFEFKRFGPKIWELRQTWPNAKKWCV